MTDTTESFRVEVVCDEHRDRPRVIDSFIYAFHIDTERFEWRHESSRKTGGGKLDRASGLRDWYEQEPSRRTVREDFADGIPRVRLRCPSHGHPDISVGTWQDFVRDYLEPCRNGGLHSLRVRRIAQMQTAPTRRAR